MKLSDSRPPARRLRRRGMTLIELTIAMTIAAGASISATTLFIMSARFLSQGFTETRSIQQASLALERISRELNHAFRPDAIVAANRPAIADDHRSITYTIPLQAGGVERRRLRFDEPGRHVLQERRQNDGTWSAVTERPLLRDVADFAIENQEGIISIVVRIEVDMARQGVKRYTMVGRALPRNL